MCQFCSPQAEWRQMEAGDSDTRARWDLHSCAVRRGVCVCVCVCMCACILVHALVGKLSSAE